MIVRRSSSRASKAARSTRAGRRTGAAPKRKSASRKSSKQTTSSKRTTSARALIGIKRAYDALGPGDGLLVLVDRLWPRGVSKSDLKVDAWVRDLAPSTALRQWYAHDVARYAEFRRRYLDELKRAADGVRALRAAIKGRKATLVTATRDVEHSQAPILREALMRGR
jgi:uncharacterized protein YeaO (DUF488 family)